MAAKEARLPMGVLRFEHCERQYWKCDKPRLASIKCPGCKKKVSQRVVEPCSEMIGATQAFCLTVRPSFTSFKRYTRDCLLHIGISDDKGALVFDFDETGLHHRKWPEALCVPLDPARSKFGSDGWNRALELHFNDEKDRSKYVAEYHTLDNNCYSFVIRFLNFVEYDGSSDHTKESIAVIIGDYVFRFEKFFKWYNETDKTVDKIGLQPPPVCLQ